MKSKPSFTFRTNVLPRHIRPLFLQLEYGVWYSNPEMTELLRLNGLNVEGSDIVFANVDNWSMMKIGEKRVENIEGPRIYFRLTDFGKQLQQILSTNQELFFDLIHFLMYSTWYRTKNPNFGRFWIYASVCDVLWDRAPGSSNSFEITGSLQLEAQNKFPEYEPKIPQPSISTVFTWLVALTPPFLSKETNRSLLFSRKRTSCSPQLFHLALDLIYNQKQLKYGTSMAIGDEEIKVICRICLLDENRFWEMVDRTKMIIRGVDIRRGQFSTSIALEMKPQWIDLPHYSNEIELNNGFEGEEE